MPDTHRPTGPGAPATAFEGLKFVEQLALWSLRFWAESYREDRRPYGQLDQAYRLAGARDGMPALDGFMSVVLTGHSRPVDVHCLKCGGLSPDETRILAALAACQRGRWDFAAEMIAAFLQPASVRVGLSMIVAWGDCLARAGHRLPLREVVDLAPLAAPPAGQDERAQAAAPRLLH